jgi:hypothetical protein
MKETEGRPRCRWEGNIEMVLGDGGCDNMDWIRLVQDRDQWRALVNTVLKLWVSIQFWEILE